MSGEIGQIVTYTPPAQEQLELLRKLRDMGASRVEFCEGLMMLLEVQFFPAAPAAREGDIAPKDMSLGGPEMCKCGHDETTHGQGGYCLRGCDMAKCGPVSDTT